MSMAPVELCLAFIAILVATWVYLFKLRRWAGLNLPPGPPSVPVLGSLPAFLAMGSRKQPAHQTLADLSKRYGPVMFLRLGCRPCVVASSPEAFREIFKNQDQVFASRPKTTAMDIFSDNGLGVALAPLGDSWRHMRKLVMRELLVPKRIREFESQRVAEMSAMVTAMRYHGSQNPINLRDMFKAFTFNNITNMAFGKRFYGYYGNAGQGEDHTHKGPGPQLKLISPEEAKHFIDLTEENICMPGTMLIGDLIPNLSFLDRFSSVKSRMEYVHKKLHAYLNRIVDEHKRQPEPEILTFLDLLLRLGGKDIDGSQLLDESAITALCNDLVTGGTDTTAFTMEWNMAEIIRHPEVTSKLVAELDAVVGKERLVTEADIPNLRYLQAVVKESLRLHPVGALLIPHSSVRQTKLLGYDIPESTTVLSNIWAVHRDPAFWDNPLEFRPERFLDNPEIDTSQQTFELMPFGSGRRGCPGMTLGLHTVQYCLARLFQAFQWSPPPGMKPEDLDMEETFRLALTRTNVLKAIPTARLASHLY